MKMLGHLWLSSEWLIIYIAYHSQNGSSFNRIYAKGPLIASCVRTLCLFFLMGKHRWHLVGKS